MENISFGLSIRSNTWVWEVSGSTLTLASLPISQNWSDKIDIGFSYS